MGRVVNVPVVRTLDISTTHGIWSSLPDDGERDIPMIPPRTVPALKWSGLLRVADP
jgi:hypothetical protein